MRNAIPFAIMKSVTRPSIYVSLFHEFDPLLSTKFFCIIFQLLLTKRHFKWNDIGLEMNIQMVFNTKFVDLSNV